VTPEELATYEAHDHEPRFGVYAGTCCMRSLDDIEQARKTPEVKAWTLFDMDLVR
jgi:hypothetical protein